MVGLHMQIGEVATRTGLSLRTIRYYEEVGLVAPTARTEGRFRLYTETDVARLMLIKRMKPLEFALEEIRELLGLLDSLDSGSLTSAERAPLMERLAMYHTAALERCTQLRAQLEQAEQFAADIRRETQHQRQLARH